MGFKNIGSIGNSIGNIGSVISSPKANLPIQQILDIANAYLENARNAQDPNVALVFCHDTEVSLSILKRSGKQIKDNAMRGRIATVYSELADLLEYQGRQDEASAFYKKSEKWG